MWNLILILITIFICYQMIMHSKETFQEGNKMGGIAIATIIPIVVFFSICFQLFK